MRVVGRGKDTANIFVSQAGMEPFRHGFLSKGFKQKKYHDPLAAPGGSRIGIHVCRTKGQSAGALCPELQAGVSA